MPLYRVNKAGSVGYIDRNDLRPYELPPQGWSDVSNARMLNGSALSVSPWAQLADLGDGTAHALDFYNNPAAGPQHIYAYLDDKILSVDNNGNTLTVSKAGLISSPYPNQIWITDQFSNIPIATNNRDAPQCFYNPGGVVDETTLSQDFPNWPAGVLARIVVPYKNFIVALNIVDGEAFPNMIWWSDAAEPGRMPDNWDFADTTSLSGRRTLGAGAGAILGAKVLRDSLFIYTEYATYRLDFVRGQFVMANKPVFANSGIFGPRCVVAYGERHFVITKSDVIIHDGQQLRSVGDEKIRNRFFQSISDEDTNRVWAQIYRKFSEIWVGVPQVVTKAFDVVAPLQWEESAWSIRNLPDSRYMRELPVLEASATDDSWDNGPDDSWDNGPDNIWNAGGAVGDLEPVVTSTDGNLYVMDRGDQTEDTILQREDINLNGDDSRAMIQSIYPRMRGQMAIQVRVGSSDTVEGAITWRNYSDYNPQVDNKIKSRALGRRHAIEFRGRGFTLEGYDIEFVPKGRR